MTADSKPGNASADKWREAFEKNRKESDLALTKLEVRAEMKSVGEDEISSVIDQRALEAQRAKESEPPTKASILLVVHTMARKLSATGALIAGVVLGLAVIAAYVVLQLKK